MTPFRLDRYYSTKNYWFIASGSPIKKIRTNKRIFEIIKTRNGRSLLNRFYWGLSFDLQFLLMVGSDISVPSDRSFYFTAFHDAVRHERVKSCTHLIAAGFDAKGYLRCNKIYIRNPLLDAMLTDVIIN